MQWCGSIDSIGKFLFLFDKSFVPQHIFVCVELICVVGQLLFVYFSC